MPWVISLMLLSVRCKLNKLIKILVSVDAKPNV